MNKALFIQYKPNISWMAKRDIEAKFDLRYINFYEENVNEYRCEDEKNIVPTLKSIRGIRDAWVAARNENWNGYAPRNGRTNGNGNGHGNGRGNGRK